MKLLRYVAFSNNPSGGNPAGIVLDATGMEDAEMAETARRVGYSETAFAVPRSEGVLHVRYFSPLTEVPFCGHATIALAVAFAHSFGPGELLLHTAAGQVPVTTRADPTGAVTATLVSVPPRSAPIGAQVLAELLRCLHWQPTDLDHALPPYAAYAGAWHPLLMAATRARLAELNYAMEPLTRLMRRHDWATVTLGWRESETVFHMRNPFPVGGVVEDPATGAAAAALGGYLREFNLIQTPAVLTVHQGQDMGRPSLIGVGVPADPAQGISITGSAVPL